MRAMGSIITLIFATGILAACGNDRAASYTLYRNSPFDHALRVHWATFDANDKGSYNMNNCLMAARLLNGNVTASAKAEGKERDSMTGFWCEAGPFKEEGSMQTYFPEAFPTDA